jgi:hypothetical protein
MRNFVMSHDEHCISTFLPGLIIPLRHTSNIFSKCSLLYLSGGQVIHELLVARDGFACNKMYHRISLVFEINMGQWGSFFLEDTGCVRRRGVKCFSHHDGIEGLLQDKPRSSHGNRGSSSHSDGWHNVVFFNGWKKHPFY